MKIIIRIIIILILSARNVAGGEKDKYNYLWLDPDKSVYVLQNKEFEAKNTFYTDLGYIRGISPKFQDVKGFKLDFGYHLNEEWSLELFYNNYSNSDNQTYKNVQIINGGEPFVRRINSTYGAMAVWSPFYGKINTFNKIYYFDWSFFSSHSTQLTNFHLGSVNSLGLKKLDFSNFCCKLVLKSKIKQRIHLLWL